MSLHRLAGLIILLAVFGCLPLALGDEAVDSSATTAPSTQPDAVAWISQPPEHWPQIVLRNEITEKKWLPWHGANGFLMKMPSGPIVAVSEPWLEGINYKDFKHSVLAWSMNPPGQPDNSVNLGDLVMPPDKIQSMEVVMLTVGPIYPWPSEVLLPSSRPAEVGDTVYLVGALDHDDQTPQYVFKGKVRVLNHPTPGLIAFEFHAKVPPKSFPGAPILDANGHVVGVDLSYYPEATHGEKIMGAGFQITTAMGAANLPAQALAASQQPTTKPAVDPNQLAETALGTARAYIAAQMYDIARVKLQKIIDTWPDSPAAKDAQMELDGLQGK